MDTKCIANIAQNRVVLKCYSVFAKQCIALRGEREDLESSKNPGNFLSILKLMSNHNDIYVPTCNDNATYISP